MVSGETPTSTTDATMDTTFVATTSTSIVDIKLTDKNWVGTHEFKILTKVGTRTGTDDFSANQALSSASFNFVVNNPCDSTHASFAASEFTLETFKKRFKAPWPGTNTGTDIAEERVTIPHYTGNINLSDITTSNNYQNIWLLEAREQGGQVVLTYEVP